MAVERETFKFPDELEAEKAQANQEVSDELDIQIEDDTPKEDRGKAPMPKDIVEDLENDDLNEYSEKVRERLRQMKKVWHDERREKERAQREREEALRFAQLREQENKQLKQRIGNNERTIVQEAEKAANNELSAAKERLRQAYDTGDSTRITEAQEALTDAKLKIQSIARVKPTLQIQEESVEENQQVPAYQPQSEPVSDPKAEAWRRKNGWFGADDEMTALALGLHEKLVKSGVDPRSDEYYRKIDETMRRRYPEAFDDAEEEEKPQTKQVQKPARNKPATVVAPATRGTAPRQVRLSPSQVAIAKKLGLSNEQYARELIRLGDDNG
jgi:hypothetical protein